MANASIARSRLSLTTRQAKFVSKMLVKEFETLAAWSRIGDGKSFSPLSRADKQVIREAVQRFAR